MDTEKRVYKAWLFNKCFDLGEKIPNRLRKYPNVNVKGQGKCDYGTKCTHCQQYGIQKIILYKEYSRTHFLNDIAPIHMDWSVQFPSKIKPFGSNNIPEPIVNSRLGSNYGKR